MRNSGGARRTHNRTRPTARARIARPGPDETPHRINALLHHGRFSASVRGPPRPRRDQFSLRPGTASESADPEDASRGCGIHPISWTPPERRIWVSWSDGSVGRSRMSSRLRRYGWFSRAVRGGSRSRPHRVRGSGLGAPGEGGPWEGKPGELTTAEREELQCLRRGRPCFRPPLSAPPWESRGVATTRSRVLSSDLLRHPSRLGSLSRGNAPFFSPGPRSGERCRGGPMIRELFEAVRELRLDPSQPVLVLVEGLLVELRAALFPPGGRRWAVRRSRAGLGRFKPSSG
jgi:hypothetical protein